MPTMSENQPVIRQWPATFYLEEDKKWYKGCLMLSQGFLSFQEQCVGKIYVAIDFDSVSDVKVERAWLGYNNVVVLVGTKKFWFSSFSSSQSVKQILLHFVKEWLLTSQHSHSTIPSNSSNRSKLGSKLLSLAHDSHKTLAEAASQLASQGEQLDSTLDTTDVIQRDLDIASDNLDGLEAWLGRWHINTTVLDQTPAQQNSSNSETRSDEPQVFPIVYSIKPSIEDTGTLIITPDELVIQDAKLKKVMDFTLKQISVVSVTTPWTLVVRRRMLGEADVRCSVTSAKLIHILKALKPKLNDRIEYDESDDIKFISADCGMDGITDKRTQLIGSDDVQSKTSESTWRQLASGPPASGQQTQMSSQSDEVTESEAAELRNVLKDFKSLAVEVGNELDVQDEKISTLTTVVTNLTEDVNTSNKRMKRLL